MDLTIYGPGNQRGCKPKLLEPRDLATHGSGKPKTWQSGDLATRGFGNPRICQPRDLGTWGLPTEDAGGRSGSAAGCAAALGDTHGCKHQ
eukprot:365557-Chlamydomonas_euryale.AAC.2